MSASAPAVRRTPLTLSPNPRRVIAKAYLPGEEIGTGSDSRVAHLVDRILAIPEADVAALVASVLGDFDSRHRGFEQTLERHCDLVLRHIGRTRTPPTSAGRERRLLIGAYFTHEYSVEAAALFNPSIVFAPDQSDVPAGHRRFVMSLRAVGEGHISSIEFRSGILDSASELTLDPVPEFQKLVTGRRTLPVRYDKQAFKAKLSELGADNDIAWSVLSRLGEQFTLDALEMALGRLEQAGPPHAVSHETAKLIHVLAVSSYVTTFPPDSDLSERVIFPAGPHETHGMEDARFVRFVDDDGAVRYYATYTAYDGFEILPQLIETQDFLSFRISTLTGAAAQNKGMALFPRRIGGKYVMLSRKDRENLHLATSDDVRSWNDAVDLRKPSTPWDLVQIGNCGSPLETDAGWLVLTHGVGPMRRYAIGAMLLDIADPRRVIGYLRDPLLVADETEREGYVPNVLYSCGGLIDERDEGDTLVLPYGFSDRGIHIARIAVPELLRKLRSDAERIPA